MQEVLLVRPIEPHYDRLARWLRVGANASAQGSVVHEEELKSGRYLVSEEWPSRAAYLDFVRYRETFDAMLHAEADGGGS